MSKDKICKCCADKVTKAKFKSTGEECVLKALNYGKYCKYYYEYQLDYILGLPRRKK